MTRKTASNTGKAAQKALADAERPLEPIFDLSDEERAAFDGITAELPRDSWGPYRLRLATMLSRLMLYTENLMLELAIEGSIIDNPKGTPIANPKQAALGQNMNTIQSMSRTLGLSASQRGVSETSTKSAKVMERKASATIASINGKSLLG